MDGQLQTELSRHESVIEHWMLRVVADGGIDRYDDLHVDEIDIEWKTRAKWVEAALDAFPIAVSVRDRCGLHVSVVLAFALTTDSMTPLTDLADIEQLEAQLSWMPPSLYVFRPGNEFWNDVDSEASTVIERIVAPVFDSLGPRACYLMEFRNNETGELCRSLFVYS